VERGKTRPNTMMTGHTGYITHARKIIKPPTKESSQSLLQEAMPEVTVEKPIEQDENIEESVEEETA